MIVEGLILLLLWVFDSSIRHYLSTFFKLMAEKPPKLAAQSTFNQVIKPEKFTSPSDIYEFEAREKVLANEDDGSPLSERKAIQKAICITVEGADSEEDVKKWQFVCNVCNKAFDSINSCEKHIIENEHTSLPIENNQDENFEVLRCQLEMLRKMNGDVNVEADEIAVSNGFESRNRSQINEFGINKDFLPIHFGKWSKVICELRHRFDKVYDENNQVIDVHKSFNSELANFCFTPGTTQTIQKNTNINDAIQKNVGQAEYQTTFVTNNPSISKSEVELMFKGTAIKINSPVHPYDRESQSNKSSTITELSELTLPSDIENRQNEDDTTKKEGRLSSSTTETVNCQAKTSKVYVDFVTRLLYCESCLTTFNSIEQAFTHFKTDGDSDKSGDQYAWDEYDMLNQMNRADDKLILSNTVDNTENCTIDDPTLGNEISALSENETFSSTRDNDESENVDKTNSPMENFSKTDEGKHDFDNHQEENSFDSYSENVPLVLEYSKAGYASEKRRQKRKKKKKKKAWKILKRSMMYTITFLF